MLLLIMTNTKTFQVIKNDKAVWVVIRQIAGIDRMYKVGDRIKGYGLVVGVKV